MSSELVEQRNSGIVLPSLIANEGEEAGRRFVEFFTANIPNDNTRETYAQAMKHSKP